ncbi:MAG: methyltransferase domain-containing protein [Bacteroidales bacterium]|nr:methyltransferase domain-containing protein [Bacteroidales bacterium]
MNYMDPRIRRHPLGFCEVIDKPSTQELQQYYANKYYQEGNGSYELVYTEDELMYFRAKLEQREAILKQHLPVENSKGRILDVGCGEGYALAYFREQGWTVKGIDFSDEGVSSKNPDCCDALESGDIFELIATEISRGEKYDLIWLQNVLEHVIEPLDLLSSLRSLVSPGGMAVITVPNDYSITQQAALDNNYIDEEFWVAIPDHLSYFDYDSLVNSTRETGWECMEIVGDFPIDWFLFHPESNYIRDKSVGKKAHFARIEIENHIHKQPIKDVIKFWSAAAKIGVGRDLTIFLRPKEV